MKVSREEAAANRDRVVEVASRLFREKGFDGIGVADLMKGAGLTHGGFYGHFKSKGDLAGQACGRALGRSADKWAALVEQAGGDGFAAIVKNYLSQRHRDEPGTGCAFATLGADAARQGPAFRRAFTDGLNAFLGVLHGLMPGRTKADKRRQSLAAMSQMVGAVILSRSVSDPAFADEILRASVADLTGRNG